MIDQKSVKRKSRGNGQGTAFKRGSKWTAQITVSIERDENGKITNRRYKSKGGFKTKREALEYIAVLKNEPVGINNRITFSGLYELWSKPHFARVSKDAQNGYIAAYKKCEPLWARVFADIKTADLQKVIDEAKSLPRTKKDGTIEPSKKLSRRAKVDIKSLFSNMYKYAMQNDYVDKNYSEFVRLPPKERSKKDAFTKAELDALWKDYNSGNAFTGYILVMCYTGMRYGEISIIKKNNINLSDRYMIGGIKTEAGRNREIPIMEKIAPIVERLSTETIDGVCDAKSKKFLDIPEKTFYTLFYVALARAGVRKLNPHCCRHTCATMLMESGAPAAIITAIMGHEDISTTMGYTHVKLAEKLVAMNDLRC